MRTSPRIDEWVKLYADGLSVWAIAEQYGVSATAVHAGLKRRGVQCRSISEAKIGRRQPYNAVAQRKYFVADERIFQHIDSEAKAYWLGFLLADGGVSTSVGSRPKFGEHRIRRHILAVTLSDVDRSHLEAFNAFLGSTYQLEGTHGKNSNPGVRLAVCSEPLVEDLITHGCVPNKTFVVELPKDVLEPDLVRHVIRGYFDGDGSVTTYKTSEARTKAKASFTSGSLVLLEQIKGVLNVAGIDGIGLYKSKQRAYSLDVRNKGDIPKFYHYLYDGATVFLERKKLKFEGYLGLVT